MYDYTDVVELPPTDIADAEAYLTKQARDGGKALFGVTGSLMLAGGVVFGNMFVAPALAGTSTANQAAGASFGVAATASGQNADLTANTGLAGGLAGGAGSGIVIRGASLTRLPVTAGSSTGGKTFGRSSAGFGSGALGTTVQPGGVFSSSSPSPFTSSSASPFAGGPKAGSGLGAGSGGAVDPALAAAAALSQMPALSFSTTSTTTTATGSAHSAAGSSGVAIAAAGSVAAGASSTSHTTQAASTSTPKPSSSASASPSASGSPSSSPSARPQQTQQAQQTQQSQQGQQTQREDAPRQSRNTVLAATAKVHNDD